MAKLTDQEQSFIDAAKNNDLQKLKDLIAQGVNIEVTDDDGKTALICAARWGQTEAAKLLLEAGANIEAKDENGNTALIFAREYNDMDIITLLEAEPARRAAVKEKEKAQESEIKRNAESVTSLILALQTRSRRGPLPVLKRRRHSR